MAEMIRSKENKQIKRFGKLSSSKSYRKAEGAFVIESVKLVKEAFFSGVAFELVMITEGCYEKFGEDEEMAAVLRAVPYAFIDPALENKLSYTKTPQGIYAICKMLDKTLVPSKIISKGEYCFLYDLQDPGNVGTILRAAEAFGADGVLFSENCCDLYNPKVLRSAMGAAFRIPVLQLSDSVDFLKKAREHGCNTIASVVEKTACDIRKAPLSKSNILLIGNEGNGIPGRVQALCAQLATIHMRGKAESLNAATAAAVLLWELTSRAKDENKAE